MFAHYACVRQADQSDCGAAALATVALHYRRPIALQRLRDLVGTDRSGTNLLGLLHAAEALVSRLKPSRARTKHSPRCLFLPLRM